MFIFQGYTMMSSRLCTCTSMSLPGSRQLTLRNIGAPEQFFCSSEVYELHVNKNGDKELRIHAENCMHCKTCDIKSPEDGVTWVVPNGGNGPDFQNM